MDLRDMTLAGEADALDQIVEARVGAERVEAGIDP
jgi:hypothetical protein